MRYLQSHDNGMKKRIAILTTHRANNFGAILQAYSLVTYCRELGVDAEILDYRTPLFEKQYHTGWRFGRNPIRTLRYLYWYWHDERNARRKFEEFRKTLPLSRPYVTSAQLKVAEREYDAFIVGSDQVWNPNQTAPNDPAHFDRTYLLDFVHKKAKYAYAASMGNATIQPESVVPEYVTAWRTFAGISMREKAGAEFVSRHLDVDTPTVVDPVFLHDAAFWRDQESKEPFPKKYVLIYNVQHYRPESKWMIRQAYEYASTINARVYNLLVPSAPSSKIKRDDLSVGPREFLKLIDEADAVFTNSFHATAFSVIFGKKLFLHKAEAAGTTNSRFDFLSTWCDRSIQVYKCCDCEQICFLDCNNRTLTGLDVVKHISMNLLRQWAKD